MTPLRLLLALTLSSLSAAGFAAGPRAIKAGAFAADISPTTFPTPVNGSMKGNFAKGITDPMHARALALHDGRNELILCVVDACMIPREICEAAKAIAAKATGVSASRMLISATHSHSCATMTGVFQSEPDPAYIAALPPRIAQALVKAHQNLEPAELAWSRDADPTQVFNRRWFVKNGERYENPFDSTADRAWMNPGVKNAKVTAPAGPVDPDVSILAARARSDGRPLAVLANYSLHYVGGLPAISADYFGAFARELATRLETTDARYHGKPAFVGIMSNGTSGDINNVNYAAAVAAPRKPPGEQIKFVASSVADAAMRAWEKLDWKSDVPLASAERDLTFAVRKATPAELERARRIVDTTPRDKDGQFSDRKAIYAREALLLADYPDRVPVKLQAHRIGGLTIAAIPCEVFVEIGLELKAAKPLQEHFTISLANGYNGYLPTPEHHRLGGYETWRARSSYLEENASTTITETLKEMLVGVVATTRAAAPAPADVIVPREKIVLFDGKSRKDLSAFYTWLPKFGRHDPDKVFTVVDQVDGAPAIRSSGQHWGGIVTHANYANYKLVTEFRWGLVTWAPRANKTRDSGILLHGQGADGNAAKDFKSPWMSSVEYQIIEGGTGDIILVNGFDRGSSAVIAPRLLAKVQPGKNYWDPAGTLAEFTKGRINWQHRDPAWKDVLGYRGPKDVEKPVGEWNRIEAICEGGNVDYFLNGVKVMEGRDGSFTWGKLLFQSEGAEIYFRLIELHPLGNSQKF